MCAVRMDEARVLGEDGSYRVVQLRGRPLRLGNDFYDPLRHKDQLVCRHCDAGVHFSKAVLSAGGSSLPGRSAHFHTNAGQTHSPSCKWPKLEEEAAPSKQTVFDKTKGFRFHLNTLDYVHADPHRPSDLYERDKNGPRYHLKNDDLRGREIVRVSSVADFVDQMKKGEIARVQDSCVVFRGAVYPWERFFIHPRKPERLDDLYQRLSQLPKGNPLPVLMQLTTSKPHSFKYFDQSKRVFASAIEGAADSHGHRRAYQPVIHLKNADDTTLLWSFVKPASYLVMGLVSLGMQERDGKRTHYFNIAAHRHQQIMPVNLQEIVTQAREAQKKRAAKADYFPKSVQPVSFAP